MNSRAALQQIHLFADVLSPRQLDEFARLCKVRFFREGSILMHQGDFGSSMFGILHGRASVTFVDRLDRENAVTTVAAGEVVGEMAMLTGDRRSATVTAVTDVDAVEITRSGLEKLFVEAPELMDAFAASLARRKAQLDQLTAEPANTAGWNIVARVRKLFGASHHAARRCR